MCFRKPVVLPMGKICMWSKLQQLTSNEWKVKYFPLVEKQKYKVAKNGNPQ